MFHVCLYQPEIAPNTGNIIRVCANAGTALHLIAPLGFTLDEARLRRAGLDYREWVEVREHGSLEACLEALGAPRVVAFTTRAAARHDAFAYRAGDLLLFGPESRGLPPAVVARVPAGHRVRIPMRPGSRSLNLSNAVAVGVFEAWRQHGFAGAAR